MASKFTVSTIFAAIDKMSGPLDKMSAGVDKLGRSVKKTSDSASSGFGQIGKVVGSSALAIGAAAITAGAALTKLSLDVALSGDSIAKTARAIGMTSDRLQEFRYIGELSGVTISEMDLAMTKMTINLGKGGSIIEENLSAMGLTVKQLKAAGPDEVMNLLADGFQNITDPTEKARIAVEIFGKSGIRMVGVLDAGREGIAKMSAEAHDLGYVMQGDLLAASEKLNDDILRMKTTFKAVGNQIAANFIPVIDKVVNKVTEMSKAGKSGFAQAFSGIGEVLGEVVVQVLPVLESVFSVLAPVLNLVAGLLKALAPVFTMIAKVVNQLAPVIGLLADLLGQILVPVIDMVVLMIEPWIDILTVLLMALSPIIKVVILLASVVLKVFNSLPGPVKTAIMMILNPLMAFPILLGAIWGPVKSLVINNLDSIKAVAQGIGDFFVGLWDGIKTGFLTAFDFIKMYFFTIADVILSTYGNVFKTILDISAKVGKALGLDVSGLENVIGGIGKAQESVRSQSAIGQLSAQSTTQTITNRSEVAVNFNNAPAGTSMKQTGQAPGVSLNLGYAAMYAR